MRDAAHNAPAMRITLKLFATLTDHLPTAGRQGNEVDIDVPDASTITEILAPFALPEKLVHLVLVNGHYIEPAQRASHTLREGDVLAIWPPIAGG